jgi:hypothetical protein
MEASESHGHLTIGGIIPIDGSFHVHPSIKREGGSVCSDDEGK